MRYLAIYSLLILIIFAFPQSGWANSASALTKAINQARIAQGLERLKPLDSLDKVAFTVGKEALQAHNNPNRKARPVGDILKLIRHPFERTVFLASASNLSPQQQVNNWLEKPKNREMIYSDQFTQIGVAANRQIIRDSRGEGVLWTVVFVRPKLPAPASWRDSAQRFINQFRAQYKLPPLKLNPLLDETAQKFSRRMALKDFVAHKAPEGDRIGQRVTASGYRWHKVLENLHGGSRLPRQAVDAWIASKKGHREAMLEPHITEMGIGYYFLPFDEGAARYTHYWTLVMAIPKDN